ncbi:hypothetical protein [Haloferula sp. A504]|uniref:hypothetical protein n=1 Tax=Haloferula sp. A504 TaxID=3373601 RepID=UPI0031C52934|nr:hypothetical protein [Verrucomicrobiaceae bacterium E54]
MLHLERHAIEWIEIRAGRVRVLKGSLGVARLREIEALIDIDGFPAHTAFWVTRSRQIHFKPNFPHDLRPALRDLMP